MVLLALGERPGLVFLFYWGFGDREIKSGAFARLRFHPYCAAMLFYYSFTKREANAGTRIEPSAVQAPKKQEDMLLVLRVDADAIVFYSEGPFFLVFKGIDIH